MCVCVSVHTDVYNIYSFVFVKINVRMCFKQSISAIKIFVDCWQRYLLSVQFFLLLFSVYTLYCDSGGGSSLASKLRSLSSESFVQLLVTIFKIVRVMYIYYFFCPLKFDLLMVLLQNTNNVTIMVF